MDYADIPWKKEKKKENYENIMGKYFWYNYQYLHITTRFAFNNLSALMSDIIIRITI